jgi:hypothetical protein
MIIAKEKRKTNVAEYIIYMWHLEDLLRACKLDIDVVQQKVIDGFQANKEAIVEIKDWYESLIHMMRSENIVESGHLQMVKNTVGEMNEIHQLLLKSNKEQNYMRCFFMAKPNINLFRSKSNTPEASDIEICLNALYSLLLLKMSGKELSVETMESMDTFSQLLATFSAKYKAWEEGSLDIK